MKIAINGFGRIGRQIFRIAYEKGIKIVLINDPNITIEEARILLQYDSVYGKFHHSVSIDGKSLEINKEKIILTNENDFSRINLSKVDMLVEASGNEACLEMCKKLAKKENSPKIILTYHTKEADVFIVQGTTNKKLSKIRNRKIFSTSSCDGVAITPILKSFEHRGIQSVYIVSLHPYLSYQQVLDSTSHSKISKSLAFIRATPNNLIPKTTGIDGVCTDLLPFLKGKIAVYQIRVPTPCVSCSFLEITFKKNFSEDDLKLWLDKLKPPVFSINSDELVSIDFCNDNHSVIIDTRWLNVDKNKLRLMIWYDNEAGYSARVVDIISGLLETADD